MDSGEHGRQDQELEQVWFTGVHSEIGGGTSDSSLSDIPFLWLVDKARAQGLQFKADQPANGSPDIGVPPPAPNYAAAIVQSRRGPWQLLHPYHRLREQSVREAPNQWIASSAERRFREGIGGYSPQGLRGSTRRGISDHAGTRRARQALLTAM